MGPWKNWRRRCLSKASLASEARKFINGESGSEAQQDMLATWAPAPHKRVPREPKNPCQADRIWPQQLPWVRPALYFSPATQKHGVFMITSSTRLGWNQHWTPKLKEKPCIDNPFFKAQLQYQAQDLACICIWQEAVNQVKEHFMVLFFSWLFKNLLGISFLPKRDFNSTHAQRGENINAVLRQLSAESSMHRLSRRPLQLCDTQN